MDGSSYPPRPEEPQDYDVESDDRRHLVLLIVLFLAAAGLFFSLHRRDAIRLGDCLMGGGLTCEAHKMPPDAARLYEGNIEPPLKMMLDDPILHRLMACDHVEMAELLTLIDAAKRRFTVPDEGTG